MHKATISTFASGRDIKLDAPRVEDIDIRDIALSLSNLNRYTGHTRRALSVAEHSIMVSRFCAPEFRLEGLLHDAQEAYLGDVSAPLKTLLGEYAVLEAKWAAAVELKFGLKKMPAQVKHLDHLARVAEMHVLMGKDLYRGVDDTDWNCVYEMVRFLKGVTAVGPEPTDLIFQADYAGHFERVFISEFRELTSGRYLASLQDRIRADD